MSGKSSKIEKIVIKPDYTKEAGKQYKTEFKTGPHKNKRDKRKNQKEKRDIEKELDE